MPSAHPFIIVTRSHSLTQSSGFEQDRNQALKSPDRASLTWGAWLFCPLSTIKLSISPSFPLTLGTSCWSSPMAISGHKSEAACSQGRSRCGMVLRQEGVAQWLDLATHAPPGGARLGSESILCRLYPLEELPLVEWWPCCPFQTPPQAAWGSRPQLVGRPCGFPVKSSWSAGSLKKQTGPLLEPLLQGRAPGEGSFAVF